MLNLSILRLTIFSHVKLIAFSLSLLLLNACGGDNASQLYEKGSDPAPVQNLEWIAGELGGIGNANGPIGRFAYPMGIAVNDAGVVYVSDSKWGAIRAISPNGVVSNFAATASSQIWFNKEFDGGDFAYRSGLALDAAGNLYVAGDRTCQIRRITPAGVSSLFAGQSGCGYLDGNKEIAQFGRISSIAIDRAGAIYVADEDNFVVRKISQTGVVSTLAGKAGVDEVRDGVGADARFSGLSGVAVDTLGTVYVGDDYGRQLRSVTPNGVVSTKQIKWASSGELIKFKPHALRAIVTDQAGNLYAINGTKIIKIASTGLATILVGTNGRSSTRFVVEGKGETIQFRGLFSGDEHTGFSEYTFGMLSIDKNNNLYFADPSDKVIRKITPDGWVTVIAGRPELESHYSIDGAGTAVRFVAHPDNFDSNVAEIERRNNLLPDKEGNVYVKRRGYMYKYVVRKLNPTGEVSSIKDLDSYPDAIAKDGTQYWYNSAGIVRLTANTSSFWKSQWVGSTYRSREIRTDTDGFDYETISDPVDGVGDRATFFNVMDMSLDEKGNIYVIDRDVIYSPLVPPPWVRPRLPDMRDEGGLIRKITPAGVVTTLAGSLDEHGYADGPGNKARFHVPSSLVVNKDGYIFVADTYNHTIRKISPTGFVSTFAGTPTVAGSEDGVGTEASFNSPNILVFDRYGNLYVADSGNFLIRKITPRGRVTTIAGTPGSRGVIPGKLPASLSFISGMTIDSNDNLVIFSENSLLKIALRQK